MKQGWIEIVTIWVVVAVATVLITVFDPEMALVWAGAILAGSIATVSLIHLFKEEADGFVRKSVYVAGGSFLMLSIASIFLLLT